MKDESKPDGRRSKFKPVIHCHLPNAVNSFMISNDSGALCGGNARMFFPWFEIFSEDGFPTLRYPAVFKSRASAMRAIDEDRSYLTRMETK